MDIKSASFEYVKSLCRFILKTDDDAFVNVPVFVQQLRLLCESPDCRRERLYMGKQCRRGQVILSPGHKWNNGIYYNHTGRHFSYLSSLMMMLGCKCVAAAV